MKKIRALIFGFIGTMLLAWLGNYFYDSTKNIPVLKYFIGFLSWLYNEVIEVLLFPIKVWWLLVGSLLVYFIYKITTNRQEIYPEFINYKKDVFKNWIWRWDWELTTKGWAVINLVPFCPYDDVQLINNSNFLHAQAYCPKCNRRFGEYENPLENEVDTKVLIHDKISKDTYRRDQ